MKFPISLITGSLALFFVGNPVFAEAPAATHPCKTLEAACTSAGFFKGGWKQGKGLFRNCMHPLLAGQTVAGVTANPADISACQAKKAQHQKQ